MPLYAAGSGRPPKERRVLFMAALCNRRPLYFCAVVCSSSSFFFSSPILSRRRLDVCHTSTHGVALVRIYDAGLKHAVRGLLEMQDPASHFVGLYLRN